VRLFFFFFGKVLSPSAPCSACPFCLTKCERGAWGCLLIVILTNQPGMATPGCLSTVVNITLSTPGLINKTVINREHLSTWLIVSSPLPASRVPSTPYCLRNVGSRLTVGYPLGILLEGCVPPVSHCLKCLCRFDQVILFPLLDHMF
jgi:hypothetical protein